MRFSQMKGAAFNTQWRMVLVHGLAPDEFMNEKAILVVALNVFVLLYNIDRLAIENKDNG